MHLLFEPMHLLIFDALQLFDLFFLQRFFRLLLLRSLFINGRLSRLIWIIYGINIRVSTVVTNIRFSLWDIEEAWCAFLTDTVIDFFNLVISLKD